LPDIGNFGIDGIFIIDEKGRTPQLSHQALQFGNSIPQARVFVQRWIISEMKGGVVSAMRQGTYQEKRHSPESGVVDLINAETGLKKTMGKN
jgi:hypothetical protein